MLLEQRVNSDSCREVDGVRDSNGSNVDAEEVFNLTTVECIFLSDLFC